MAKEYIEREAAIAAVDCTEVIVGDWIRNNIQKIPAADVAPVVHGEYIERKAAIALADGGCHPANVATEIAKLPAADVAPVKRGRWVVTQTFADCVYAKCSDCDSTQVFYYGKPLTNYCPNCGASMDADMREVDDEM